LSKTGKTIGITQVDTIELVESRASDADSRKREEADALRAKLPADCTLIAFDERGKSPSSRAFAISVQSMLDGGTGSVALVIGGPDGLSPELRNQAAHVVSFCALTLPHQLVRVMVAEQAYRAATILTGHPYHRD